MKSILLVGLGKFGKHIALQLHQLGHQVMGVDHNEDRINDTIDIMTNAQIGDSTNEEFLCSLGVGNYDVCIVTIGNDFQSSLETTCLLKELGAKFVVSRAERDGQAKFLLRTVVKFQECERALPDCFVLISYRLFSAFRNHLF